MSFDVNVLSSKPVIREAQSMQNDGGGGNLGYMSQGHGEKQKKKFQDEKSIFETKDETDTFGFEKDVKMPEEENSAAKIIAKIIYNTKMLFTNKK